MINTNILKISFIMLLFCTVAKAQKIKSVYVSGETAALRLTPQDNGELITRAIKYSPFRIKEAVDNWYLVEEFYTNCRYYVNKNQVTAFDVRKDSLEAPTGSFSKSIREGRRTKIDIVWSVSTDTTSTDKSSVLIAYKKLTNGRLTDKTILKGKMLNSCTILCEKKMKDDGSEQKTHRLFWYVQDRLIINGHEYDKES